MDSRSGTFRLSPGSPLPDAGFGEPRCLGVSLFYDFLVISHQFKQPDGIAGGGFSLFQLIVKDNISVRHILLEMIITGFLTLVNRILWQKPHNCGFFYVKFIKI